MNRETLKRLAANPDYISGIYNYCDQWCERCPFTARCGNFALGCEASPDDAGRDNRNAESWKEIADMLLASIELLYDMAEERGLDLDSVDETEIMAEREQQREDDESQPCVVASKVYADRVGEWFETADDLFQKKNEAFATAQRLGLAAPTTEAERLNDAVEIIRWHQYQIHVKLMRAFHSRHNEERLTHVLASFPKDSDGSAKVALIGIDRSMAGWGVLLRAFSARETETLRILAHLERLRRDVEREFSAARAFVRPGFDAAGA